MGQRPGDLDAIIKQFGLTADPPQLVRSTPQSSDLDSIIKQYGLTGPQNDEPGNIDLRNRPHVKNDDGTISTVRSMSFQDDDGREVLIPTVVGDRVVSDDEAIDHYRKSGEHLGKFSSPEAATAYAQQLHNDYAAGKYEASPLWRRAADYGVSLMKGFGEVPEAAVGLADIPTLGHVGKFLKDTLGYDPAADRAIWESMYTPEQKQAYENVRRAEGFIGTGKAIIQNSSTIPHSIMESLPGMFAGGAAGGMVGKAIPAVEAIAGGIGEGLQQAGSAAEQTRQDMKSGTITPKQSVSAFASGIGTGALGVLGGKLSHYLGIDDIDTIAASIAGKKVSAEASAELAKKEVGVVRKIIYGAFSEGVLEEFPQGIQEQVWQNYAEDRPLDEGVAQSAVLSMVAGAVMGGGANVMHGGPPKRVSPPSRAPIEDQPEGAGVNPPIPPPQAPITPAPPPPQVPQRPIAPEPAPEPAPPITPTQKPIQEPTPGLPPPTEEPIPEPGPTPPVEEEPAPQFAQRLHRGSGASREAVYGKDAVEQGRAVPLFGPGRYYAFNEEDAKRYGEVSAEDVSLRTPFTLTSDKQWFQLLRDADTPHLDNMSAPFYREPQKVPAATEKLQKYLRNQGYDGIIVKLDQDGDRTRRLQAMVGHDQVVAFGAPESAAEPVIAKESPANFDQVLKAAQKLDPNVGPEGLRLDYDERVALIEDAKPNREEAIQGGHDPVDVARTIASLGGINERDKALGNRYFNRQTGELTALKDDAKNQGYGNSGAFGSMFGVRAVFRDGGLPTDVLIQHMHQFPRFKWIETPNDLREFLSDAMRAKDKATSQMRLGDLGIDPEKQWWVPPPQRRGVPPFTAQRRQDMKAGFGQGADRGGNTDFNPSDLEVTGKPPIKSTAIKVEPQYIADADEREAKRDEISARARESARKDPSLPEAPPDDYETLKALRDRQSNKGYAPDMLSPERQKRAVEKGWITKSKNNARFTEEGARRLHEWSRMDRDHDLALGALQDKLVDEALEPFDRAQDKPPIKDNEDNGIASPRTDFERGLLAKSGKTLNKALQIRDYLEGLPESNVDHPDHALWGQYHDRIDDWITAEENRRYEERRVRKGLPPKPDWSALGKKSDRIESFPSLLDFAKKQMPPALAAKVTSEKQVESYRAQWEKERAAFNERYAPKKSKPVDVALPGDVGKVRDVEVETPKIPLPQQGLTLKAEDAPESMREKPPALFDEDDEEEADSGDVSESRSASSAVADNADDKDKKKSKDFYDEEPGPEGGDNTRVPGGKVFGLDIPELVALAKELAQIPQIVRGFRKLGKLGEFNSGKGRIRITAALFQKGRERELAQVLAHEIGHMIDWLPDFDLKRGNLLGRLYSLHGFLKHTFVDPAGDTIKLADIKRELKEVSRQWRPWEESTAPKTFKTYRNSSVELMADAMSALLTDPEFLQHTAPIFYEKFFDALQRKPDVEQEYYGLQAIMQMTPEERSGHRLETDREMFERGEAMALDVRRSLLKKIKELRFKNFWLALRSQLINRHAVWPTLQKRNPGVMVPEDADPNLLVSERNYVGGKNKAWLERNIDPLLHRLADANVSWHDFGLFLHYDRIIKGDREFKANPGGTNPEVAKGKQEALTKQYTDDEMKVIQEAMGKFRFAIQDIVKQAHKVGIYSDDNFAKFSEFYVTYHVLDYIHEDVRAQVRPSTGTFKDVANVANASILKMMATIKEIENQKAKLAGFAYLRSIASNEIEDGESLAHPKRPTNRDLRPVHYLKNGSWHTMHVDPYVADSLNNDSIGKNIMVVKMLNYVNSRLFRPIFTGLNPGFQSFNTMRDFLRAWKLTPGLSMAKQVGLYVRGMSMAKVRAFGLSDPDETGARAELKRGLLAMLGLSYQNQLTGKGDLIQAEAGGMLSVPFNQFNTTRDVADTEIADILTRYSAIQGDAPPIGWRALPVIKQARGVFEFIANVGDFIETLPKAAAMYHLAGTDRQIGDLTPQEREFIRTRPGSPDYLAGGTLKPMTNEVFLFSNAIVQGVMADWQALSAPFRAPGGFQAKARAVTTSGVLWKTMASNVLPKVLMLAATAGLCGDWLKALFGKVSEYDKTNYLVVPLGMDDKGNAIYIRVPQDDTGRLLGGLVWKAMRLAKGDKDVADTLQQVVDYTLGQFPSVTPTIGTVFDVKAMAGGQNPYDDFRSRNLFTDTEMAAGGPQKWKKFIGWEFQQLGGGIVWKFFPGETRPQEQTTGQKILELPIASNIIGRWFRVSNFGEIESLRDSKKIIKQDEARHTLAEQRQVDDAIREYMKTPPFERQGNRGMGKRFALARKIAEGVYTDVAKRDDGTINRDELSRRTNLIQKKIQMGTVRGSADPLTEVVIGATNIEKRTLIERARKSMSPQEYDGWLDRAASNSVISRELSHELKRNARH